MFPNKTNITQILTDMIYNLSSDNVKLNLHYYVTNKTSKFNMITENQRRCLQMSAILEDALRTGREPVE